MVALRMSNTSASSASSSASHGKALNGRVFANEGGSQQAQLRKRNRNAMTVRNKQKLLRGKHEQVCRCEPKSDLEIVYSDDSTPTRNPVEVSSVAATGDAKESGEQKTHDTTIWELLKFTVPTMGIWLASPILSLVDATVVGSQSVTELAALTPGTVLVDYLVYVFTFLGIAVTSILSVSVADRNASLTESRLNDGLTLALISGGMLGAVIFYFNAKLFPLVISTGAADLIAPASVYASIRALGIPFALIGMVLQCAFLASKNTKVPLVSTLIGGAANLIGDIAMVNYLGLGIAGAAWATVLSQVLTVVVLIAPLRSKFAGMPYRMRITIPTLSSLLEFVRIAGPVSIILLSKVVVFSVVSFSAANLGSIGSAAHTLLFNVFLFFCVPGDALNQCAQTFLPPVAGMLRTERKLKNRLMFTGLFIGMANSVLGAFIIFVIPQILARSVDVTKAMQGAGLLLSAILFLHPFGISTEGILMAKKNFDYLLGTYMFNMLCMLGLVRLISATGSSLNKVWGALVMMQILRLAANAVKIVPQQLRKIPSNADDQQQQGGSTTASPKLAH